MSVLKGAMKKGVKKRVLQCIKEAICHILWCDMAGKEIRLRGTHREEVKAAINQ